MSEYGQMIFEYEPEKDALMVAITEYFGNPTMVKIENDDNRYSKYMTKTYCLLSNECQYLIAIVNDDSMPMGHQQKIEKIPWICFQTRTLPIRDDIPSHSYEPRRGGELQTLIKRVRKDARTSTYSCDKFPIEITLLGDGKGGAPYQDDGSIIAALQTFQTIITFTT